MRKKKNTSQMSCFPSFILKNCSKDSDSLCTSHTVVQTMATKKNLTALQTVLLASIPAYEKKLG